MLARMTISLEHDKLKADLSGSAAALGVKVVRNEIKRASLTGRLDRHCTLMVALPKATQINARFVREGFLERAKKLFVDEVEVGSAVFDDLIYVVTSTRDATAALLEHGRVQQALLLLVDESRHVEVEGDEIRIVDDDARDDGRDATAEALALAAFLMDPPKLKNEPQL
jgi:hypothetical protein